MVHFHRQAGFFGEGTGPNGGYSFNSVPVGTYTVQFGSCGPGGPDPGNWAPQWYRGKYSQARANEVTVRAGRITRGISAIMRRGGQITGVVTGKGGSRLSRVCVYVESANGKVFVTQVETERGKYRADALDAGRYRVYFDPACGFRPTRYLGQWWPGAATFKRSKPVTVRLGKVTANVNAALRVGGTIAGTVRFENSRGKPLAGICVFGQGLGAVSSVQPSATTGEDGGYVMEGLPAGRYTLSFGAVGCGNNGNYLYYNDPHAVRVTVGRTVQVKVYLRPGAIIKGKVTSAATGLPLAGICVSVNDPFGDGTVTTADGSFYLDQIQSGRYSVGFFGGCGNKGSYAPQWFPGRSEQFNAALLTFQAGKVASGINAAMRPGSGVSGVVTSTAGVPLRGICVGTLAPSEAGFFGGGFNPYNGTTRHDGSYKVQNLAPGQYQIVFFSCDFGFSPQPGWITQWYRSRRDLGSAGLLDVPAAATVTGIDAALTRGGAISGTVSEPSGKPFSFICITATNLKSGASAATEADSFPSGYPVPYTITGLAPGRYRVFFYDCGGSGFASQWYSRKATRHAANPVTVTAGHVTRHINARLASAATGGSISGTVTALAAGRPVAGICVTAFAAAGFAFGGARTDARGDYRVRHLESGRYHLFFGSCRGNRYAYQMRPGAVQVRAPHAVRGINFAVELAGSISGAVLGATPAPAPRRGVCVSAVPMSAISVSYGFAVTARGGRYLIGGLAAGRYKVYFDPVGCGIATQPFAPQWYNGQTSRSAATPVTVSAGGATTGIGATLLSDGTISGTVTGPAPASPPLTGVCVEAAPFGGNPSRPVYTVSEAGSYTLTGLRPGTYLVIFTSGCGATGYTRQYWPAASSSGTAKVITVAPGAATTGIDAAMHP